MSFLFLGKASSPLSLDHFDRGAGGLQPKKPKTTANFKFGAGFFFVFFLGFSVFFGFFHFGRFSGLVVLVGYNSFDRVL